jgi:hypothetical protein
MTNFDENEKSELSSIQLRAIASLAQGENITTVAEELNLSRQTVSSWVNSHAEFQNALRQLRAQMLDESASRVRGLTARALDVVSEGLENPNYRIRLTAATKILSLNTSALIPPSKPPEAKTPAKLCENCEQEKISEIMSGFDQ